jgi:hypothetical protein
MNTKLNNSQKFFLIKNDFFKNNFFKKLKIKK